MNRYYVDHTALYHKNKFTSFDFYGISSKSGLRLKNNPSARIPTHLLKTLPKSLTTKSMQELPKKKPSHTQKPSFSLDLRGVCLSRNEKNVGNISDSSLPHQLSELNLPKITAPVSVEKYIRMRNKGFFTADLMGAEIKIPGKIPKIWGVFKRVMAIKQPPRQFRPYYDARVENLFTDVKKLKVRYNPQQSKRLKKLFRQLKKRTWVE
jgi:hypothetical protein